MMMGIMNCVLPYPDPWADDGKVWAYYNITKTDSATSILYRTAGITNMSIDGGAYVSPTTTYTFGTTGEHLVKFTLSSAAFGGSDGNFRTINALKRLYMPDTVTSIGNTQFYQNTGVTFIRFSPNVRTIAANAFATTSALKVAINLPALTSMGNNAFQASGITKIESLGNITTTPENCFRQCNSLASVELPSTLSSLGQTTFFADTALKTIVCKAVTPPTIGTQALTQVSPSSIQVPAESVDAYKSASGWSAFASKILAIPE